MKKTIEEDSQEPANSYVKMSKKEIKAMNEALKRMDESALARFLEETKAWREGPCLKGDAALV